MKVFSFGGGVQSHTALALTQQGVLDYDVFLFCNVGDKAENEETLAYIENVTIPYCERHGIEFHVLRKIRYASNVRLGLKKGETEDLYDQITRPNTRSIQIPIRMENGAPGRRNCTQAFKIEVIDRWCREHGATEKNPYTVGIGISLDEIGRMRTDQPNATQRREYPLITKRITREQCHEINEAAGFLNVPRSACWFCPMKKASEWRDQALNQPEVFQRSLALERFLNEKRATLGKDDIYFTHAKGRGLALPVLAANLGIELEDTDDGCDTGHCFV